MLKIHMAFTGRLVRTSDSGPYITCCGTLVGLFGAFVCFANPVKDGYRI